MTTHTHIQMIHIWFVLLLSFPMVMFTLTGTDTQSDYCKQRRIMIRCIHSLLVLGITQSQKRTGEQVSERTVEQVIARQVSSERMCDVCECDLCVQQFKWDSIVSSCSFFLLLSSDTIPI